MYEYFCPLSVYPYINKIQIIKQCLYQLNSHSSGVRIAIATYKLQNNYRKVTYKLINVLRCYGHYLADELEMTSHLICVLKFRPDSVE